MCCICHCCMWHFSLLNLNSFSANIRKSLCGSCDDNQIFFMYFFFCSIQMHTKKMRKRNKKLLFCAQNFPSFVMNEWKKQQSVEWNWISFLFCACIHDDDGNDERNLKGKLRTIWFFFCSLFGELRKWHGILWTTRFFLVEFFSIFFLFLIFLMEVKKYSRQPFWGTSAKIFKESQKPSPKEPRNSSNPPNRKATVKKIVHQKKFHFHFTAPQCIQML